MLTEATTDNFDELIAEGTVLVDVWGPDCAPCVALNPHVEKLAEARPELTIAKLEGPKNRRLCMRLRIMGMPVFLLYRNGEEAARLVDPKLTSDRLDEWLDEQLASAG